MIPLGLANIVILKGYGAGAGVKGMGLLPTLCWSGVTMNGTHRRQGHHFKNSRNSRLLHDRHWVTYVNLKNILP